VTILDDTSGEIVLHFSNNLLQFVTKTCTFPFKCINGKNKIKVLNDKSRIGNNFFLKKKKRITLSTKAPVVYS
jgi:hypothetical protein